MNEVVRIPRAEYEALLRAREDLEDYLALDAHRAEPGDGVSGEFVERMLNGESLVRLWREHRGLTQAALSERSGVNRAQIAEIEGGRKTGSVATVKKLAEALGVAIDDLV